ncbi:M81 family metallopeptidase [Rhodovarius lipocyclicus]|uniref:M81 family metallopeptidase n=1 Tax=Rhodovarius lipocyclicus TaxID=268410 RepID=UPI001356C493|nr:M81 family metallopeptidase [Rhodovarius lipocyclicus]
MSAPRIALLGFSIECNRWAPVATLHDFTNRCLLRGEEIVTDARAASSRALGEMPGFVTAMDATGPWQPRPVMLAMSEPWGPVARDVFEGFMAEWRAGLEPLRGQVEGVYAVLHGAGLAEHLHDPEGALQALVREILGDVPFVCSYDLHGNISAENVALNDAFVGYRTNPHLDMRERGVESAQLMRRLLAGERFVRAHRRLPIIAPTVSMLTAQGPYAEVINLGQQRAGMDPRIANVSVMGGFAYGDTPFNGMTVVVTATERDAAEALAQELAEAAWARRHRFIARLTPIEEATQRALTSDVPLAFADVADNPGGGGRGNTMEILRAFHAAGVRGAVFGVINDARLAAEAHQLGKGARFTAVFNQGGLDEFSREFSAPAEVVELSDGQVTGRRGIYGGTVMQLGKTARLRLVSDPPRPAGPEAVNRPHDAGGIEVVVISERTQCADPAFLEHLGIDIAAQRAVVVKSRGHFRGGFDEFFQHDQIVEVDGPGLTSPILTRFDWKHVPRPSLPIDTEATWP